MQSFSCQQHDGTAIPPATTVTVTLPGGERHRFAFAPRPPDNPFAEDYTPAFVNVNATGAALEVEQDFIRPMDDGVLVRSGLTQNYNPERSVGVYTLTTRDGTAYEIDARTGDVRSITDRNLNRLTFTNNFITSRDPEGGVLAQVEIDRDAEDRIISLTDPAGDRITYDYDPHTGDLIAVTNRAAETTTFEYDTALTGRDHFLTGVTDHRGVTVLSVGFDEDGRLESITDASGQSAPFAYTLSRDDGLFVETVADAHDVPTEIVRDLVGDPIRRVQHLQPAGSPDPEYRITVHEYNVHGQPTRESQPFIVDDAFLASLDPGEDLYNFDAEQLVPGFVWATTTEYDHRGSVARITDALGNETIQTHDDFGNRLTHTDPLGHTTRWTYDGFDEPLNNNALIVEEPDGGVTIHESSPSGEPSRILRFTEEAGHLVSQFTWSAGLLASVTDAADVTRRFVHDDAGNQTVTYHHFTDGPIEQTVATRSDFDAEGRATATRGYLLDGHLTLTAAEDLDPETPLWQTATTYTPTGQVETATDRFGTLTQNVYNVRGEQIETRTEAVDEAGTPVWRVTRTAYDDNGRVIATSDPYLFNQSDERITPVGDLRVTHTIYDALGRVVETRRLAGLEITITEEDYGDNGLHPHANFDTGYDDQNPDIVLSRSETVYDAAGRVARSIDARDNVTDYEYDEAGRQVAVIGPEVDDPDHTGAGDPDLVRLRTEHEYDGAGRQTAVVTNIRQIVDGDGPGQDALDYSQATRTLHEYDAAGRQTAVVSAKFEDPDDPEQGVRLRTEHEYDVLGNRVLVRENIRQQGVEPDLDSSDPRETRYEYDASGRLVAVILPAVEHPDTQQLVHPRYEYEYDDFGNQTIIRDNVHQSDPLDPGTIDAGDARQTVLTYDAFGRQLTRTLSESQQERFEYNDLGQRTLHVSFEGRVTEFQYDNSPGAGGQLAEKRFFTDEAAFDDGNGTPDQTISYTYDAYGRIVETVDSEHGTWTTAYDADGRVIEEGSPQGVVGYDYNNLGDLIATFTANTKTEYGYDDLGRLETVTMAERQGQALPAPEITTYTYDLVGNLDTVLHANDLLSDYTYDELNRLTLLTHHGPDDGGTRPLLASFDYTLNLDGGRAAVEQVFTGDFVGEASDLVTTIEWEYDALNRLVQETYTTNYDATLDYVTTYTFDLVGNRLEMATTYDDGGPPVTDTTTYTYDNNDRLLTETLNHANSAEDRHTVYGYDATEQASKTVHEGLDDTGPVASETTYSYNLQGRMARIEIDANGDGQTDTTIEYAYNDNGIRVKQSVTEGGQTITHEYVIDANNHTGHAQVLEEWIDGQLISTFTIGHTILAQHDLTNGTLTLLVDGHNSTMALVNELAELVQRFAYDAYGNMLEGAGLTPASAALTAHLYAGEQFDAKLGMQYLRARYYDPATGRFNRLDPRDGDNRDPQTLHRYLYAHADPINGIDPSGEARIGITAITTIRIANTLARITRATVTMFRTTSAAVRATQVGRLAQLNIHLFRQVRQLNFFTRLGQFRSFTLRNARHNLQILTGRNPRNADANHVFIRAEESWFRSKGINIHDPRNMTWWARPSHQQNARAYQDAWRAWIADNRNASTLRVLAQGRRLMEQFGQLW